MKSQPFLIKNTNLPLSLASASFPQSMAVIDNNVIRDVRPSHVKSLTETVRKRSVW